MAPDTLTVGGLNAVSQSDFQAQSKTFSLSSLSRNSAFRWGQVPLPCLSLLHDLSIHPDIAPTVQSKASCIHREPHTRSGLGLLVLKYGCLNGLSASYITLQQEGQQASDAIPDTKPYPCSYCASRAKKKKKKSLPAQSDKELASSAPCQRGTEPGPSGGSASLLHACGTTHKPLPHACIQRTPHRS